MEVLVSGQGDVAVMELVGRMDATTTAQFEDAARTLQAEGHGKILIDMDRLEYISSAGLRGILGLVKSQKAAAGGLAFCSLQPMVTEVFRISGFSAMLSVHATREEALAALAG